MHINTAVGEIRRYYLNLPKKDLTEGGEFTGEILKKLLETYRKEMREHKHICPYCNGSGWIIVGSTAEPSREWCERCEGTGEVSCEVIDKYFDPEQTSSSSDDLPF